MAVIGLIPARLQSTRLPNKLLLDETGKPLLQYTWEAACNARKLDRVIVATDSRQIADVVTRFGGEVAMTGEHPSGTDRIAEVVRRLGWEVSIAVNIQGDEPDIDPSQIDRLVETLQEDKGVQMSTLGTPIRQLTVLKDASCTKVVCDEQGRALYFSRSMIPFCRDRNPEDLLEEDSPWLLHLGLYAYRRDFLLQLTELPPSRLEKLEKLEQLRALEAGARIQVAVVEHRSVGIDTPDDYAQFVSRQIRKAA
ncbi:MAG: 3-deoxy-manno-octulosonate cytidylyltransferase [Planctomycetaceae bacterium]